MNRRLYTLHRWISAVAFLQLSIWTLTGSFFAFFPIERVRGLSVEGAHDASLPANGQLVAPPLAVEMAAGAGVMDPISIELRARPQGVFYIVRNKERAVRIDARTGTLSPVSRAEAEETARRDQFNHPLAKSVEGVSREDVAYREKPLPAWCVVLDDPSETHVYVDATTGEVTARRNSLWRTYDFFWSLHIMDYTGRESFHHPLILIAAFLAVLTVASGASLWSIRLFRRWRARASR
jgi:uncharacterized iron-regulated membrane protein